MICPACKYRLQPLGLCLPGWILICSYSGCRLRFGPNMDLYEMSNAEVESLVNADQRRIAKLVDRSAIPAKGSAS